MNLMQFLLAPKVETKILLVGLIIFSTIPANNNTVDAFFTTTGSVVHHIYDQQQKGSVSVSSSSSAFQLFDKSITTTTTTTATTGAARTTTTTTKTTVLRLTASIYNNDNNNYNDEDNINLNLQFGIHNIPGEDYQRPSKVNQDSWFIECIESKENVLPPIYCFGILDGHGKDGHHLSNYFATNLPSIIQNQLLVDSGRKHMLELEERIQTLANFDLNTSNANNNQYHQALINSFHQVHWNSMEDPTLKSGRSGSTCIACLLVPIIEEEEVGCSSNINCCYDLHVASVGDSRAIAITTLSSNIDDNTNGEEEEEEEPPNNSQKQQQKEEDYEISILAKEMTVSNNIFERNRIESCDDSTIRGNNVFYGPVGIAMTRALGDSVMIRSGVIPTPIVETYRIQNKKTTSTSTTTLILATDGIWDVLSNNEVAGIIQLVKERTNDDDTKQQQKKAAQQLANAAKQKWYGDLPINDEVKMDDITVMVLELCGDDGGGGGNSNGGGSSELKKD